MYVSSFIPFPIASLAVLFCLHRRRFQRYSSCSSGFTRQLQWILMNKPILFMTYCEALKTFQLLQVYFIKILQQIVHLWYDVFLPCALFIKGSGEAKVIEVGGGRELRLRSLLRPRVHLQCHACLAIRNFGNFVILFL